MLYVNNKENNDNLVPTWEILHKKNKHKICAQMRQLNKGTQR